MTSGVDRVVLEEVSARSSRFGKGMAVTGGPQLLVVAGAFFNVVTGEGNLEPTGPVNSSFDPSS